MIAPGERTQIELAIEAHLKAQPYNERGKAQRLWQAAIADAFIAGVEHERMRIELLASRQRPPCSCGRMHSPDVCPYRPYHAEE